MAWVHLHRLTQGAGTGLKAAFGDVVAVEAIDIFHIERDAGILGKGLEEFAEKLGVEITQLLGGESHLPDQIGPA